MKKREFRYFASDFETTVDSLDKILNNGIQEYTEVWSACFLELFSTEEPTIIGNIEDFMEYFFSLKQNICLYFHNLKFDGSFILDYLLRYGYTFNKTRELNMNNNTFKCAISQMGQFYSITVKKNDVIIEFRDSLKLLPFSLKSIGESFNTEHKKLEMNYKGNYYRNCPISDKNKSYIQNDVYVLKEALEIMFNEGHNDLTIGSCCLKEFKSEIEKTDYKILFPNMYDILLDEKIFGSPNAGEYIRKSYHGGWCYVKRGCEGKTFYDGATYDVNSLYPSEMHSDSKNKYPYGKPKFFRKEIPSILPNQLYFVRFKCYFELKKDKLPTVQIKNNLLYRSTEYLETSDIYYKGKYYKKIQRNDETIDSIVTLTMTSIDYELFLEHYNTTDLEILDGCIFYSLIGMFDNYINKYKKQKQESTGARRTLAKLFLNNLYGKMAASTDSSYKIPYLNTEKDCVSFTLVEEKEKIAGYIPVGSFITSYSRNFTIRAAQANYSSFIYADTDSLHMLNTPPLSMTIHDSNFCAWKNETKWSKAKFIRQKTYIEDIYEEDCVPLPKNKTIIKCAGMTQTCKDNFTKLYTFDDFQLGLKLDGKLRPKRIHGGVLLIDTTYNMN